MELIFDSIGWIFQGIGYLIAGFITLVVLAMVFGQKVHWKFEAEGFCEAFVNSKVRIKIKELAKTGQTLELKGKLAEKYQGKHIDVFLNNRRILTIDKQQNDGSRHSITESIEIEQPNTGDRLLLTVGGEEVYSERLV